MLAFQAEAALLPLHADPLPPRAPAPPTLPVVTPDGVEIQDARWCVLTSKSLLVRRENMPVLPASDGSVVRIYPSRARVRGEDPSRIIIFYRYHYSALLLRL